MKQKIVFGTTFSQLQCQYMGLDYPQVFSTIDQLPITIVRLCSYWNEIEPKVDQFNFKVLDQLLTTAVKKKLAVILTVGMKAPRWPEFHLPTWIEEQVDDKLLQLDQHPFVAERTLKLIERIVKYSRDLPNIIAYQVENEPRNKMAITQSRFIGANFLAEEVSLVKKLKKLNQQILLTNAIDLFPPTKGADYQLFQENATLADTVGLNVYNKVPIKGPFYLEANNLFWHKLKDFKKAAERLEKQLIVTEAQAEPWENGSAVHLEKREYPSASPALTAKLVQKLAALGCQQILLWGYEYWYYQKQKGNDSWWAAMDQLMQYNYDHE